MSDASRLVRVVVVVNWRRQTVHGMTCDNAEAVAWTRDLLDKYDGDNLCASMFVSLVDPTKQPAVA